LTFLYIARGSAGEVRSMLCLLAKISLFAGLESEIRNLKSRTESISKQIGAWTRMLRDSELKGQRYVSERRAVPTSQRTIAPSSSRSWNVFGTEVNLASHSDVSSRGTLPAVVILQPSDVRAAVAFPAVVIPAVSMLQP